MYHKKYISARPFFGVPARGVPLGGCSGWLWPAFDRRAAVGAQSMSGLRSGARWPAAGLPIREWQHWVDNRL